MYKLKSSKTIFHRHIRIDNNNVNSLPLKIKEKLLLLGSIIKLKDNDADTATGKTGSENTGSKATGKTGSEKIGSKETGKAGSEKIGSKETGKAGGESKKTS